MGTTTDPGGGWQARAAAAILILLALLGIAAPAPVIASEHWTHPTTAVNHATPVRPAPIEILDMANFRAP